MKIKLNVKFEKTFLILEIFMIIKENIYKHMYWQYNAYGGDNV